MMKTRNIFIFALGLAAISCNDDGFRGGGDGVKARSGNIESYCSPNSFASQGHGDIAGLGGTDLKVSGEFCTVSLDANPDPAVSVIMVVDTSGSMEGADPGNGTTCGRLSAANTVLANIVPAGMTDRNGNPPLVNVGVIAFDQQARTQVPLTPIANISSAMNFQNFCSYSGGATNYQAAFEAANELAKQAHGNKVVYFISDGLPTTYGTSLISQIFGTGQDRDTAKQRGIEAAAKVRGNPSTTLNVLFLKNNDPKYNDPLEPDPMPYLQQIAPPENGRQRVAIAQNAGELAEKIQLFGRPEPSRVNSNGLVGVLFADGFGSRSVNVDIDKSSSDQSRTRYITESFKLFGRPGQTVVNTLKVTATASDGSRPESVTIINFTQNSTVL